MGCAAGKRIDLSTEALNGGEEEPYFNIIAQMQKVLEMLVIPIDFSFHLVYNSF